jgi:hypothetical protein
VIPISGAVGQNMQPLLDALWKMVHPDGKGEDGWRED